MRRREDWPGRLDEVVRGALGRPFAWGQHDCALFACDACHAMTGVDPAAAVRGKYKTAKGAARAIKRLFGAGSLPALATTTLGAPQAAELARRGDIACVQTERGPALGVVLGQWAAYPGPATLTFVPIEKARACWPLGWG